MAVSEAAAARSVQTPAARPSALPARARMSPSVINCPTMRPRPAPSARRMAVSLRRLDPRASCMFATLRLATTRTMSAAPISAPIPSTPSRSSSVGELPCWNRDRRLTMMTRLASFCGRACASAADSARIAAFAPSAVTSGFNRPITINSRLAASWSQGACHGPGSPGNSAAAPTGIQNSGPAMAIGPANPAGAMPTTVNGRALTRIVRPRMSAGLPSRFQYGWLRTATVARLPGRSSSRVKLRPAARRTPSVAK